MSTRSTAHIIDHLGLGGQQTQLLALLPLLPAHGYEPTVLNLRGPTALSRALVAAGVPVVSLGLPRWSPRQLAALARTLRGLRPAVAHTYLTAGNLLGRLAAVAAGVPAVVMEDQISVSQEIYGLPPAVVLASRLAEPWLARRTAGYLGPSRLVQQASAAAKGWPAERCHVLPNPVNCVRFAPAPSRSALRAALGLPNLPTIATLGRFVAQKRIGHIVAVARRVAAAGLKAQFLIAGGGPQESAIRQAVAEAGVGDSVRLLGRRDDAERILAASEIYLSASAGEVLSVAILEAMASGCAVVATTAGGTTEQVEPGVSGQLVAVDDLDGLTAAVLDLLRSPSTAERLGQAGRRIAAERFAPAKVAARLTAIYAEVLAGAATERPRQHA
jgi:glycosyltransferase involved in cell wall biosynthesis